MAEILTDIYQIDRPLGVSAPFVFDSPHSGSIYPADFEYACNPDLLVKAEDTSVDLLFEDVPSRGASFLRALFPRTYIDPNRSEDDIDEDLLLDRWPAPVSKDGRSAVGHGLIRRLIRPGYPIYDRKLSVDEAQHRIGNYYLPYHQALKKLLDKTHYDHGQVWHINCHSMPSSSAYASPGATFRPLAGNQVDIVLGTRDGTTCDVNFAREVRNFLQHTGYRVSINNPYKGMELLRRYADPLRQRHSLQIEINKALYLNEDTNQILTRNFKDLKINLDKLVDFMLGYVEHSAQPLAAD